MTTQVRGHQRQTAYKVVWVQAHERTDAHRTTKVERQAKAKADIEAIRARRAWLKQGDNKQREADRYAQYRDRFF